MQNDEAILQRLDAITARLDALAEGRRATDELFEELTPIAREALATAVARLDVLDKQGYFAFLAELVQVGQRIVEGFTPADVRQLGDGVPAILDLVRALTRPEVLQIATDAAAAIHDAEHVQPIGAFGALRAMRSDDVQKGLGLVLDLVRRIGRGINHVAEHDTKAVDQKTKLAALLGPRRTRGLPAPSAPRRPAVTVPAATVASRAAPSIPAAGTRSDGHLADPAVWDHTLAESIAREQGIALDAPRWALIDAARADFAATKASPNIQRLTQVAHIATKELYHLFPKAPARTIARIAGLPKPAGCL